MGRRYGEQAAAMPPAVTGRNDPDAPVANDPDPDFPDLPQPAEDSDPEPLRPKKKSKRQRKRATKATSSSTSTADFSSINMDVTSISDLTLPEASVTQNEPEPAATSNEPAEPAPAVAEPVPVPTLAEPTELSSTSALPDDLRSEPASPPSLPQRRSRIRYRHVDFASLDVVLPTMPSTTTVIIRPTSDNVQLSSLNPKILAQELRKFGTFAEIRDISGGGLAIDFSDLTEGSSILSLTSLLGLTVACSFPVSASTCFGVLAGVHPSLTEEDLIADLVTMPETRILAAKRLARPGQDSWSVRLTFDGTSLPERAILYGRSRRVQIYKSRPLICLNCSRFGHGYRSCRSVKRCANCGDPHDLASCPTPDKPKCPSCQEPHPVNSDACPKKQLEAKICHVKNTNNVPYKTARAAVHEAAKTYAAAAAGPKKPASRLSHPAPPVLTGGFIPNVAHARPPPDPDKTLHTILGTLFKGLAIILTAANTTGDFTTTLTSIAGLFLSVLPEADPAIFSV